MLEWRRGWGVSRPCCGRKWGDRIRRYGGWWT
jgi:hypothetical protein